MTTWKEGRSHFKSPSYRHIVYRPCCYRGDVAPVTTLRILSGSCCGIFLHLVCCGVVAIVLFVVLLVMCHGPAHHRLLSIETTSLCFSLECRQYTIEFTVPLVSFVFIGVQYALI